MGVAPDFGAKVDGREGSGGVDPNVMENVGAEGSDKVKGVGVEVGDAGDITKEVALDEFLLWDPKLLTSVVNDCVLVRVAIDGKGTGRGGEEVGKNFG